MRFTDREEAGRALAGRLRDLAGRPDILVLGLPRGGLPVAAQVAEALRAPLDVINVRKLGLPGHEEFAMGAIATGGVRVLDDATVAVYQVPMGAVERVTADETFELERRERVYREGRPAPELRGRTVVLVDDGLATGATMSAAVRAVRAQGAARVVVAVPVAPPDTVARLRGEADDVVCLTLPEPFFAVGAWYDDFRQLTDADVRAILGAHRTPGAAAPAPPSGA